MRPAPPWTIGQTYAEDGVRYVYTATEGWKITALAPASPGSALPATVVSLGAPIGGYPATTVQGALTALGDDVVALKAAAAVEGDFDYVVWFEQHLN